MNMGNLVAEKGVCNLETRHVVARSRFRSCDSVPADEKLHPVRENAGHPDGAVKRDTG